MNKKTVTAENVRAYYRENESRVARLPEEARGTVAEGARGRLHPAVIKDHNRFRKVQYVSGATGVAKAAAKEQAQALRAAAREAGFTGERGPLPKAFLQSVSK